MDIKRYCSGLLLLAILLLAAVPAPAWECRKCPKRDVAVFAITAPSIGHDATLSYGDWYPMHQVSDGVLDVLFNEDPGRDCLNFIEAQMAARGDSAKKGFESGLGHYPAPAGPIGDADYIITGQIAVPQTAGRYLISISLQTAQSREEVASVSGPYDLSLGGPENGRVLARLLMPLMEKIRDFEKRKRDEAPAVAIDVDEGLEITPARRVIKTHETVKITYRLVDCDGEPLKGRIFAPFATLGRLEIKQPPQTDDNGELTLDFTAGSKSGRARLTGQFQYVQPFGREDNGGGEATLRIADHALWAAVQIRQERHFLQDEDDGRKVTKKQVHGNKAFSVYMYFEPKPFRVNYAQNRLVPVRFKHRLAGFMPDTFTHNNAGSSYEAVKGYRGVEREITASFTEMAQMQGIEPVQPDDDYVTYELDPDTGVIIRVDLPRVKALYTVYLDRTCTKVDHEKHRREDCSSKDSKEYEISTGAPSEKECHDIKGFGPTTVGGRCSAPYAGRYEKRRIDYEWEFHRE